MGVCQSAKFSKIVRSEDLYVAGAPASASEVSIEKAKSLAGNPSSASSRYHRERNVRDDYELTSEVLGEGCNGSVMTIKSKVDGRAYALKTFSKRQVDDKGVKQLALETEIYISLDHPNIARLHDVYETPLEIALVTELCQGGELYSRLVKKGTYLEPDAREATRQMLCAVGYLHSHNIVHRDLKLENFLYESDAEESPLKLIDFGFAKVWDPSVLMMASCGSIAYVSPDVLKGSGYTNKCDLWSLGVVVFMLLSGYPPFAGNEAAMRQKIREAHVNWSHKSRWANVSEAAVEFVKCLFERDPKKRPSAQQALVHRWMKEGDGVDAEAKPLSTETLRALAKYRNGSHVRRAVLQMLAQELAPEETRDLREIFISIDRDKSGTISLSELKDAIRGFDGECDPSSPKTPASRLRVASDTALLELFDVLDANKDEQIYYSDFLAATMEVRTQLREGAIRAAFHRLDADASGVITSDDLRAVVGDSFEGLDVDILIQEVSGGEGITYESFKRVLEDRDVVPTPKHRGGKQGKFGFRREDDEASLTPSQLMATVP